MFLDLEKSVLTSLHLYIPFGTTVSSCSVSDASNTNRPYLSSAKDLTRRILVLAVGVAVVGGGH